MNLNYTTYRIICSHPFGISRSTYDFYDIVYVYISDGEYVGRGEAAPSLRYDESTDKVIHELESIDNLNNMTLDEGILWCKKNANNISSLEAALSTAWLDLWFLKEQKSISDFFKLGSNMLNTSFTISIGDLDLIPKKIEEAKTYNILKSHAGKKASINGATQIRAGVIRPEVVIPLDSNSDNCKDFNEEDLIIQEGSKVRVIRQPYFGEIGIIKSLPKESITIESETKARVAEIEFINSDYKPLIDQPPSIYNV